MLNQLEDSLLAHLKEIVLNSEGVEQSDSIIQVLADFYESMGKYLSVLSASLATITYWYQNNKNLSSKELIFLLRSMLVNGVFFEVRKYSNLPANSLR